MYINGSKSFSSGHRLLKYRNNDGEWANVMGTAFATQHIYKLKESTANGAQEKAIQQKLSLPDSTYDPVIDKKQCWIDIQGNNCKSYLK